MTSDIALISGSSHPAFVDAIGKILSVKPAQRVLSKFSSGETQCEIQDSVRGKDVYIVQTFGVGTSAKAAAEAIAAKAGIELQGEDGKDVQEASGYDGYEGCETTTGGDGDGKDKAADVKPVKHTVNDYFIELCIMVSACKTGSAQRITVVLPLFPYSRQPDIPFSKVGAPLIGSSSSEHDKGEPGSDAKGKGAIDNTSSENALALVSNGVGMLDMMRGVTLMLPVMSSAPQQHPGSYTTHDYENPSLMLALQARSGHKQFTAQAGSLVANLLTCAGADRVLTCDLHESAYQGFFDIPGTCWDPFSVLSFSLLTPVLG